MYKVIYKFWDTQDPTKHVYKVGDKFPFDDREISEERIKELSGDSNLIGKVLIELEKEQTGSNGNNGSIPATPTTVAKVKPKAKTTTKKK